MSEAYRFSHAAHWIVREIPEILFKFLYRICDVFYVWLLFWIWDLQFIEWEQGSPKAVGCRVVAAVGRVYSIQ